MSCPHLSLGSFHDSESLKDFGCLFNGDDLEVFLDLLGYITKVVHVVRGDEDFLHTCPLGSEEFLGKSADGIYTALQGNFTGHTDAGRNGSAG